MKIEMTLFESVSAIRSGVGEIARFSQNLEKTTNMETIEERAKEYAQAIYGYAPAIEIAFIRGARSEHEELTCWRDPKCPPAHRKPVLIKGVTPSGRKCLVVGVVWATN